MLKRKKFKTPKVPVDPELRLAEIEIEVENVYNEIEKLEKSQPPYTYNPDNPMESYENYQVHMKPAWDKQAKLVREKRLIMTPEFKDLPDYGDVMSLKDFIDCVNSGGFIDYDGSGNYVRDNKISDIDIYPSDVKHNSVRKDFDTIIWFNR